MQFLIALFGNVFNAFFIKKKISLINLVLIHKNKSIFFNIIYSPNNIIYSRNKF